MKKLITFLLILSSLLAVAQTGTPPSYTYIGQKYNWLAGLFRAMGLPAGDGPAAFESWQAVRAGAVYYDSSGVDAGLYIYNGTSWALVAGGGPETQDLQSVLDNGNFAHTPIFLENGSHLLFSYNTITPAFQGGVTFNSGPSFGTNHEFYVEGSPLYASALRLKPWASGSSTYSFDLDGALITADRRLYLPDENGILATRQWVTDSAGGGSSGGAGLDSLVSQRVSYFDNDRPFTSAFTIPTDTSLTVTADTIFFHSTTAKTGLYFDLLGPSADTLFHNHERWEVAATVRVNQYYAVTNEGAIFGIRNTDYGLNKFWGFTIKSHGGSTTTILPTYIGNGAVAATSTVGLDFTNGDLIRVRVRRNRNKMALYLTNLNTGLSIFFEQTMGEEFTSNFRTPYLVQKFVIYPQRGNIDIFNVSISAFEGGQDVMFVGNSITDGSASGYYAKGFTRLWRDKNPAFSTTVDAGASSTSADIVKIVPSIVAAKPKNAVILIGTNDLVQGISSSTTRANIGNVVTRLTAAGINVILPSVLPISSVDVRTHNAWLQSTYPTKYVDIFTRMKTGSYALNSIYDSGDGVHPNALGHTEIAKILEDSMSSKIDTTAKVIKWGDIVGEIPRQSDLAYELSRRPTNDELTTALALKVSTSRNVLTSGSTSGGGALSADRTIVLVGDAAFGYRKKYGVNTSGNRTFVNDYSTLKPYSTTITSSGTVTPVDSLNVYVVSALALNTTIAAPNGSTVVEGQEMVIKLKDNGTSRTITWNAIYRAGTSHALPAATTISKWLICRFTYNATDTKWDLIDVDDGF